MSNFFNKTKKRLTPILTNMHQKVNNKLLLTVKFALQ